MKKKYIVGTVAIVVLSLCSYELGRYQSRTSKESNRVAYIDTKEKKTAQKMENLSPDEVSAKEGINAEQIVVKITDQGYVTSHGDHFHYYNGKVPYDAIISEELIMRDPNYVLQQSDIVNEVKDGYIIKVDGKYYLYLKDKNHTTNVRTKAEIQQQREEYSKSGARREAKGEQLTPAVEKAVKQAKAQGRYTTDDGYIFSPTDVIEDTGDAFIVPHGDHFHYIPKSDLSPSELAAAQSYWDSKSKRGSSKGEAFAGDVKHLGLQPTVHLVPSSQNQSNPDQPRPINPNHTVLQPNLIPNTPSTNQVDSIEQLLQQLYSSPINQRHVESDGLVFDPQDIIRRTANGVAVPHGDHYHFIPFSQMSPLEERLARLIEIGKNYNVSSSTTVQPSLPTPPVVLPSEPTPPHHKEVEHDSTHEVVTGKYQELVSKLNILDTDSYGYAKRELLGQLQLAHQSKNDKVFTEIDKLLNELKNFHEQKSVIAVDYLKLFYQHVNDARLSKDVRDKIAQLALTLYQNQSSTASDNLNGLFPELFKAKLDIEAIQQQGSLVPSNDKTILDTEKENGQSLKIAISKFLSEHFSDIAPATQDEVTKEEVRIFLQKAEEALTGIKDETTRASLQQEVENLRVTLQNNQINPVTIIEQAKDLLARVTGLVKQNESELSPQHQAVYEKLYPIISKLHKELEEKHASDEEKSKVDDFFKRLSQADSDKSALMKEIFDFKHDERVGKPNSQIIYSAEEIELARSLGHYVTSDGYIFDAHDIISDEGNAYITPHMGHSHWIDKNDLSEIERQEAQAYTQSKGILPPSEDDKSHFDSTNDDAQAVYNRVAPANIVPFLHMPYMTAYTVDVKNGNLIIPHKDHYHNIKLAWFNDGSFKAPAGYSLEDFFATIKFYVENPTARPDSDDGWGNASDHVLGKKDDVAEKPIEEEEPEVEPEAPDLVTPEEVQEELNKIQNLLDSLDNHPKKAEFDEIYAGLTSSLALATQTRTDLLKQAQALYQTIQNQLGNATSSEI
ncbi:pneumococcal-type histidine triad protein, partial [Streptococcus sp. DD10]|uniref:pneumococcal-type histidine triad protein n=1 Tax=Streptococcus sp. DD10 TaxID=1777878 RepID=UPI00083125F3